jgi:orotate phosphoribosyltransferase
MTGRKINQTLQILQRYHANIIGVAVLVDRSNGLNLAFENVPLRALLTYPLDLYEPDSCPMCKQNMPFTNKEK